MKRKIINPDGHTISENINMNIYNQCQYISKNMEFSHQVGGNIKQKTTEPIKQNFQL